MSEPSPLRLDDAPQPLVRWRLDRRSFVYIVVAVLMFLAALAIISGTSTMLTRIAVGVLIALALDPLANRLERRLGGRRGIAVAVLAALVLGVAALVIGVLGPRAVSEVRDFSEQFPETVGQLEDLPLVGDRIRDEDLRGRAERWVADLPSQFTDERITETARTLVSGVAAVAIVAVVAVAVLIDGQNLVNRFRRLLSPARREQADEVGRVVYRTLGRYVGGSLTVAMMMGLYVLTVGFLLGVPLAPLAAVWAMLTSLIPQVGGFLGGSFFVLLAVTESVPVALAAAALFVVYMNLENHVISPAIVGKSVDLSPPTTMVAAFVGGAVFGIPGALVATPLAGAAKQLYLEARGRRQLGEDDEPPVGLVQRVRDLAGRLWSRLRRSPDA
ncbi:AI-2E family transporter [Desertimonas flava]|uniref:AI-2E family transporter n=1 Tax=Desertimonas flava TaxID=2064846 RepID=UPI000E34BCAA|nr:AI-2E family transporter [Desertimonas flava]